jgi:hypothetical protein
MTNPQRTTQLDGSRYAAVRRFGPDVMDPRIASSASVRDRMIAKRREAGLPDYPPQPLYPDRPVRFQPGSEQHRTRRPLVAE